jgi:hypothetical protein
MGVAGVNECGWLMLGFTSAHDSAISVALLVLGTTCSAALFMAAMIAESLEQPESLDTRPKLKR